MNNIRPTEGDGRHDTHHTPTGSSRDRPGARRRHRPRSLLTRASEPQSAAAASHREAPLISLDPEADITDFFMFRSYEPGQERQGRT